MTKNFFIIFSDIGETGFGRGGFHAVEVKSSGYGSFLFKY